MISDYIVAKIVFIAIENVLEIDGRCCGCAPTTMGAFFVVAVVDVASFSIIRDGDTHKRKFRIVW